MKIIKNLVNIGMYDRVKYTNMKLNIIITLLIWKESFLFVKLQNKTFIDWIKRYLTGDLIKI